MLNRRTKPTPGLPPRPDGFPRLPESPYDFEAMLAYLRELEVRVMERLDLIFERVRNQDDSDEDCAIRLPEVRRILGDIGKSTLYGRLNPSSKLFDPRAPQPFKLGNSERSGSAWSRREVLAYRRYLAQTRNHS